MGRFSCRGAQAHRAQSLVEMALFFSVFLILILGTAQVLLALYAYLTVINASREGARYAVSGHTDVEVAQHALQVLQQAPFFAPSRAAIVVTRVTTFTSGNTTTITSYTQYSEPTLLASFTSRFTQSDVLNRITSVGTLKPGEDEFVIVEVYYEFPYTLMFSPTIPMWAYTAMRVIGY